MLCAVTGVAIVLLLSAVTQFSIKRYVIVQLIDNHFIAPDFIAKVDKPIPPSTRALEGSSLLWRGAARGARALRTYFPSALYRRICKRYPSSRSMACPGY